MGRRCPGQWWGWGCCGGRVDAVPGCRVVGGGGGWVCAGAGGGCWVRVGAGGLEEGGGQTLPWAVVGAGRAAGSGRRCPGLQGGEGEAGSGWGLGGREAGGRQMLPWAVATPSGSGDAQAVLQALSAGTGACEK